MKLRNKHKILMLGAIIFGLQGCSLQPHVRDWDRELITEIPNGQINIDVCFNKNIHSKAEVLELARKECKTRIIEVQNLVAHDTLQQVQYLDQAEGELFAGPIARKRRLDAMLKSLQLGYVDHDSFKCPIATRNRVVVKCLYDPDAIDSVPAREKPEKLPQTPERPPELPEDLKPQ